MPRNDARYAPAGSLAIDRQRPSEASFAREYGRIETAGGGARARIRARRHEARPRHRFDRETFCRACSANGFAAGPEGDRRADVGSRPAPTPRAAAFALTTLDEIDRLDLTVDGADEIDPALNLIKGGGGALLREKIVAAASDRMIVIADESKWVEVLGRFPLPIEVIPFGLAATRRAIGRAFAESGVSGQMVVRKGKDGHVFVTDGGHWIVDAHLGRIADAPRLAGLLTRSRASSSMGCSSALPARRCWRALREFALLNGGSAAIEENWNEEPFGNFVGRGPRAGAGAGRRSRPARRQPAGAAEAGLRRRRSRRPRKSWR